MKEHPGRKASMDIYSVQDEFQLSRHTLDRNTTREDKEDNKDWTTRWEPFGIQRVNTLEQEEGGVFFWREFKPFLTQTQWNERVTPTPSHLECSWKATPNNTPFSYFSIDRRPPGDVPFRAFCTTNDHTIITQERESRRLVAIDRETAELYKYHHPRLINASEAQIFQDGTIIAKFRDGEHTQLTIHPDGTISELNAGHPITLSELSLPIQGKDGELLFRFGPGILKVDKDGRHFRLEEKSPRSLERPANPVYNKTTGELYILHTEESGTISSTRAVITAIHPDGSSYKTYLPSSIRTWDLSRKVSCSNSGVIMVDIGILTAVEPISIPQGEMAETETQIDSIHITDDDRILSLTGIHVASETVRKLCISDPPVAPSSKERPKTQQTPRRHF